MACMHVGGQSLCVCVSGCAWYESVVRVCVVRMCVTYGYARILVWCVRAAWNSLTSLDTLLTPLVSEECHFNLTDVKTPETNTEVLERWTEVT